MSRTVLFGLIVLAGSLAPIGCGGTRTAQPTGPPVAPPHGGHFVDLPDGAGVAEILAESPAKGKKDASEFTVYFFGPDRTTPLSPMPTSGKISVMTPKGSQAVSLTPKGDALVSPPGSSVTSSHDNEIEGELTVDLGGKSVNVPVFIR